MKEYWIKVERVYFPLLDDHSDWRIMAEVRDFSQRLVALFEVTPGGLLKYILNDMFSQKWDVSSWANDLTW